jgi:hypothetical protein
MNITTAQHKAIRQKLLGKKHNEKLFTKVQNLPLCPFKGSWEFDADTRKESVLQEVIFKFFNSKGHVALHVPNEAKRSVIVAQMLKRQGMQVGIPDLLILDLLLAIEIKTGYNLPTENQYKWLAKLQKIGWRAVWVDSLDELIQVYKNISNEQV